MTRLATLPARFRGPFTIIGEVAGAVLTTDVTGTSRLFAVLGEVPRVSRMLCFSHWFPFSLIEVPDRATRHGINGARRIGFSSKLT
jgi:hypothetical protein